MVGFSTDSGGQLRMSWSSLDDFLSWLNGTVAPSALTYGYRVVLEPLPPAEVAVDRV